MSETDYEAELIEFARGRLGPASAAYIANEGPMDEAWRALCIGGDAGATVLAVLFSHIGEDAERDNEFAAYLIDLGTRNGGDALYAGSPARRVVDTSDVVLSVLGDMWPRIGRFTFTSEAQFAALLRERMHHKAQDYSKAAHAAKRRDDLRVDVDPHDVQRADDDESSNPIERAIRRENELAWKLIYGRMTPRQQEVLGLIQSGSSRRQIAQQIGISQEAVRQCLERAIKTARDLLQH